MRKVVFDISMSLDGFMTAANQRPEEPLGEGGEQLHQWAFGDDPRDREVLTAAAGSLGAVICGRRTYDDSLPWWAADGPTGSDRVPVFVLSHDEPADPPAGGVYTFVTGGIEDTLKQAKAAAGDKLVTVMGGAETGQQFLRAGLVDELSIHLIPVLFGGGTRMFEHLGDGHVQLEHLGSVQTAAATHLRFRVVRSVGADAAPPR
jgi:dihydrofolate reductase